MTKLQKPEPTGRLALVRRGSLLETAFAGLGPSTRRAYTGDWRRFAAWWDGRAESAVLGDFVALDVSDARRLANAYREHLEKHGCSPATVARAITALNSIVTRLHKAEPGLVRWSLDADCPRPRTYRDTHGPDLDTWRALLAVLEDAGDEPPAPRDLAVVLLLRDSALRCAEVCSLDLKHLDLVEREVWVLGKGDRGERDRVTQPVTARTADALEAWLEERGRAAGPLFWRYGGENRELVPGSRIDGRGVRYIVERWAKEAGIETRISPHRLRHAGITAAASRWTGGMPALARWARHANPSTTMIYVDNVAGQEKEIAELVGDDEGEE